MTDPHKMPGRRYRLLFLLATPHCRNVTTLPWPLHLAQLIGEYIVPVQMIEGIEAAGGGKAAE